MAVIAIIGLFIGLLLPAIEAAWRAQFANNLEQLVPAASRDGAGVQDKTIDAGFTHGRRHP